MTRKERFGNVKRILVKVGSAVLTGENGIDLNIVEQLTADIAALRERGFQVVFVTSGAIASGKHRMGIEGKLKNLPQKQAAAAIGQGRLMRVYSNAFGKHGLFVGQVLLTMSDITDRVRFLNIRNTILQLLDWGVVPIINENDPVAVEEIKFGDNDNLAAMVANIVEAHLVVNLTSANGLYDQNPNNSKKAKLIPLVSEITEEIENAAGEEGTDAGIGGMKSKVLAAKKVIAFGTPYIIAPGKRAGVLQEIMDGKEVGTLFLPSAEHLNSRKYWIAFTLRPRGRLIIDEGAKEAIAQDGKSLLPSGITDVEGDFTIGDAVSCVDANGNVIARGLANYSAEEMRKIMGLKSSQIEPTLGYKDYDEAIHRDNLAVTIHHSEKPKG
jgi:glutamate 5-kinase